ncbi:MAG: His/Gly/Thr/Pro-type tRNA ligase C-terminal domain-containing protein, partial [Phenylobacterium sp.]|uniref:His/Gly/Thr/Pro-type tRNA ligase C-terminal domain-containing protein n=1 Tax=Phenylobacterium sp. TaxID=1871053 RepID=UPI00271E7B85
VVVIAFTPDDMAHYFSVVGELRNAGIAAEVYLGTAGMKAQMKYADRRMAPAAIMLGGDEIAAGKVTIKDLDRGRMLATDVADNAEWREQRPGQQIVDRADLVATVRKIVDAQQSEAGQ